MCHVGARGAVEDPVIRLIHPAICPVGGGTTLRLTGNHFCNQSTVRIGGKDAPVLHFSDLAQGIYTPSPHSARAACAECGTRRQQRKVRWRLTCGGWW